MITPFKQQFGFVYTTAFVFFFGFLLMSFQQDPPTLDGNFLQSSECPSVSFTTNGSEFDVLSEVNFTNQTSFAISYHWDFGDGNTSSEIHPRHIYQESGTYQITLTAFFSNCQDSFIGIVDVIGG